MKIAVFNISSITILLNDNVKNGIIHEQYKTTSKIILYHS